LKENQRIKNSIKNISYGLIVTVINVLLSFVSRTIFVKLLGKEVLGLNGLFTEIIAILSLTELGVGMAVIYHLYKPFQEENYTRISQLMSLYRSAYNGVSVAILCIGLAITPFVDKLVTEINYPTQYIKTIYILFIIKTSVSYLYSYKTALLYVDQKQYIVSVIQTAVKVFFVLASAIVLLITRNYIAYLLLMIIQSIVPNIFLSNYIDKKYPYIDYKQKLCKEDRNVILTDVKDIFLKRVSGVITSSTDNVLISTLVSTIQVGLYSNYVVVFSMIRTLKIQFTQGMAASIGNLNVTESAQKCRTVLNHLTFLYYGFSMIMCSGLLAVSSQFIDMWLGKEYIMEYAIVLTAVFNLHLEIASEPLWQYLEVSGLFKWDKYVGLIGSSVNLIVSIVLGLRIGIVGIFIGTICTQTIQIILKTALLFKRKFMLSPLPYYGIWIKIIASFAVTAVIQNAIGRAIMIQNVYLDFLIKGFLAVITGGMIAVIPFLGTGEINYAKGLVMRFMKKG